MFTFYKKRNILRKKFRKSPLDGYYVKLRAAGIEKPSYQPANSVQSTLIYINIQMSLVNKQLVYVNK